MSRTGMVNIPRDVVDDYYRYKMPVLRAKVSTITGNTTNYLKVEGKGNGIKTVVENMEDIARALNRPASCKYSRYSLITYVLRHSEVLWVRTWCSHQNRHRQQQMHCER
jgi:hypothetical protein